MPSARDQPKIRTSIGVDPGGGGGMAWITWGSMYPEPAIKCHKMPATEADTLALIQSIPQMGRSAVIEKVQGYIGSGQPGSAMFKFGCNYGGLRMALIAAGIPFDEVPPQRWQKRLGIIKGGRAEGKTEWKNRLKAKAQQLYPNVDVTLAVADALLIARYCQLEY